MMIQSGRIRWAQYEVLLKGCNTGKRNAIRSFEGKKKTGRPRRRYLGNITRIDLIKI